MRAIIGYFRYVASCHQLLEIVVAYWLLST